MTCRQPVAELAPRVDSQSLALKVQPRLDPPVRQLDCSFIPVLLINIRGVRGAIGETCSSTPWWPSTAGTLVPPGAPSPCPPLDPAVVGQQGWLKAGA